MCDIANLISAGVGQWLRAARRPTVPRAETWWTGGISARVHVARTAAGAGAEPWHPLEGGMKNA